MLTRAVSMEGESTFTGKTSLRRTLANCASASMAKSGVPPKSVLHHLMRAAEALPQLMVNVVRLLTVPKMREITLKTKCQNQATFQVLVQLPKMVLVALMLKINHLSPVIWMEILQRRQLSVQMLPQSWRQDLMECTLEMKMKFCLNHGRPHPLQTLYQKCHQVQVLLPRKLQKGQ